MAKQPKQNGLIRPETQTRLGIIWDFSDDVHWHRKKEGFEHTVPSIQEIIWCCTTQLEGLEEKTIRPQFSKWLKFHGLREANKARKKFDAADAKAAGAKK